MAEDIRRILLSCNNRRLKAYLLVIASGGFRAMEALAIRYCDLDYSSFSYKGESQKGVCKEQDFKRGLHQRGSNTFLKTMAGLEISQDKENCSKRLGICNYRYDKSVKLRSVYSRVLHEFNNVLKIVGMDERKEGMNRRKITFHSFRRHLKGVLSNQVNTDYSEWFLGHNKSPYYTLKQEQRREIYLHQCMKWLTFLDFSSLQKTTKNIEFKLEEKEKEIAYLKERDSTNTELITNLSDKVLYAMSRIEKLEKRKLK